jgi:hypothetical protein
MTTTKKELTFEQWEKLPSDIKLTRGDCNQLYNILTTVDLGEDVDISKIITKLEAQI